MKITEQREAYIKADAEGRAKILAKTYGLAAHQMWNHKQSGKWIISHAGVQSIAAQEKIGVIYEVIKVEPGFVVIKGIPQYSLGDIVAIGQATFGEASKENTTQKYPVAMAEKRAYDRAVLICVLQEVGGYGADFYGEDEADDFKAARPAEPAPGHEVTPEALIKAINACKTQKRLEEIHQGGVKSGSWTGRVIDAFLAKNDELNMKGEK